ncbi:RimK/LysX family protein [Vibrio hepatarius]|uniref:putative ATP-dependent zinc protease n=1 Tax=Vibrio hepatarius TaxID=171383 RepID=UPI001C08EA31|nr:RimK/LysX family protein [Vibrio hepatarius]MBU2896813.1 RimK/LysX family protein [Vibrio hepatarius]
MKKASSALILIGTLLTMPLAWQQSIAATTQDPIYQLDGKPVLGRIENVYYSDIPELTQIPFAGKIDTGADSTSIHADNIHLYSNNPEFKQFKDDQLMWAVFGDLIGTNGTWDAEKFASANWDQNSFDAYKVHITFNIQHPITGKAITVDKKLEKLSVIRSRTSKAPILRPAIKLALTIADKKVETLVNLTDRSHFSAPILIGKTYLNDNAWVLAGYDYLQEQPNARMIGKKDLVRISDTTYKTSISTTARYTSAHGLNIQIDKKNKQVSFSLEGENKKRQAMTLPLVRMLKTSSGERPLVYLPVKIDKTHTQYWLVYLRDRSKFSSQIRIGKELASQHFVIDTDNENLLEDGQTFNSALKADPLVISTQESIKLDNITLPAHPSFTVKTPLLRVESFELTKKDQQEVVTFYLPTTTGKAEKLTKAVIKKLKVGDSVRPVVEGDFLVGNQKQSIRFALDILDKEKHQQPFFVLGHNIAKGGVLLNTRSDHLLDSEPLFKVGHIEVAQVEGMSFPVKLDTGADVSSINAKKIKQFKKNGQDMVSFIYENDVGMSKKFTKPVVDVMRIKAKKGEKANVRPVVEMQVKLGDLEKKVRVNLQDRSRFHYSMILGKNFLKHGTMVASEANYIVTDKPRYEK